MSPHHAKIYEAPWSRLTALARISTLFSFCVLRDRMGWKTWPRDILRHTCASYLMALWQDAGRVATELGNSPGILLRHYRESVRREEAERFWRLIPGRRKPDTRS